MKLLEFSDWTDVQTQQIVVLPRLEEHGALVASPSLPSPRALHQINDTIVYDWSLEDILNLLKQQTPLRLHVSDDDNDSASTVEKNEILVVEEEEIGEEKKDCDDSSLLSKATNITLPFSPMSELSSWTKRVVSETSKQVNKYKQQQQQQKQPPGVVSLFLQSNTGAFLSLQQSSAQEITNTSLLIIRKSATEPAGNDIIRSCQWYAKADDEEWRIVPGAIHTAFQPSADLAGHFLRCVVHLTDSSSLTCHTETKIQMVPTLFQGIRQATQKTTGYSSFCMVKDVTFRFSISRADSGCALRVEQVLADHSTQVVHEQLEGAHVSLASYAAPKDFQLHLPFSENDEENHSLLYELADQEGIVSCQALNRLGRESFLIAFGIANYHGDASSCQPSMILYPATVDRLSSTPSLPETLGTNHEPTSTSKVASDETTRSTTPPRSPIPPSTSSVTPPRSPIPPIPIQRSTSLDTRPHGPNEQLQQQLLELRRQNVELQKQNKQWQNEKAVLQAAIDARENKLEDAQQEIAQLKGQLEAQEKSESERQDRRLVELKSALEQLTKELQEKDSLIATVQADCKALEDKYQQGQTIVEAHQQEHAALTMKLQKLKAERCHFKQKNESLQKEIAVICKNGRTIRQVEKLIADDAARQQEVALLRQQKKEALTELEHYRTAYQEAKHAQKMAGLDLDVTRLLERNAELERLVGELTEFVEAKESQLETVKRVNEALQAEIHSLAQANMSNNDI
jgi:DNA repair exonuclease SbcCD ATPase subunit